MSIRAMTAWSLPIVPVHRAGGIGSDRRPSGNDDRLSKQAHALGPKSSTMVTKMRAKRSRLPTPALTLFVR
jgi:hypothetical protein